MCGCLSHLPTGDPARNPGLCPDWESNQRPFGSQAGTQSTEPHQPGLLKKPLSFALQKTLLRGWKDKRRAKR